MYQVLYRKWRPKTFNDVVGQEHVTKTLKNELKSGHIAHAYLFTGSRGTGRTSCAKILAKAVNCVNLQDGNPCCSCKVCEGIDSGSILDVTEIDAASNNGVENIRAIREEAVFTPAVARYRVYIIDEVHMLSIGAFNALLKILEEPPEHVIFILATTEVHKIPVTILSRCQRFDFNRISLKAMSERIKYICEQENVGISEEAALLISKFSDGALRDALSILDQCVNKGENIDVDTVLNISGVSGNESVFKIMNCIIKKDCENALKEVERLYFKSKDMSRLCEQLLVCFRDIMLFKIVGQENDLLDYNIKDELKADVNTLDLDKIVWYIEQLQCCYDQMQKGFNKKFELELCLIKLCNGDKIQYKKVIKNEPKVKNSHASIEKVATENVDAIIDMHNQDVQDENLKNLECWSEILDVLVSKGKSKSMSVAFKGSSAYEKGNYILINSPNELAFELLRESENRNQMRNAIKEVTGKNYNLGPYRKSKKTDSGNEDKLDELSNIAKNAGINVNLK